MSKSLKTFGADLAFAGIDTIDIIGKVVMNPTNRLAIEVWVADGEREAIISNFTSSEQAEAAIAIAYAGSIKDAIVGFDNRWRFDFVVSTLSMVADLNYILPTPNKGDN